MRQGARGPTGYYSTCRRRLLIFEKPCPRLANYRAVDSKASMIFPKSATEAPARLPANLIVTFLSCMRSTTSSISAGTSKREVGLAMQNHILGKAEIMGKY